MIFRNIVFTSIALHTFIYIWKFSKIYNPITYRGGGDCNTFIIFNINQYKISDFLTDLLPGPLLA